MIRDSPQEWMRCVEEDRRMLLSYHARSAALSERNRRRIQREGVTMSGSIVWTEAEIQILYQIPSNLQAHERLPHRTIKAIEHQRRKQSLSRQIHWWTAAEISKLRRMYPRCSKEEICATFPHATWNSIKHAALRHSFRREKPPYKPTGHPAIDQIREKCYAIGWSLVDLDLEAKTRRYFAHGCLRSKGPNYKAIHRALNVLQGRISIEWLEER
ncbi:hypothetical protein AOX55_0000178 [Sinorhizobium fredii CCBAU 25509]|nr:hypothetical protein AOX55_0000178 [Sinorhizobium fredii CCBAU 25509]